MGGCPIYWIYKDYDTTAILVDFPSFVMLLGDGSSWCLLLSYAKAVVQKTSGGFLQNGNLGWIQSATQPPVAVICREIFLLRSSKSPSEAGRRIGKPVQR